VATVIMTGTVTYRTGARDADRQKQTLVGSAHGMPLSWGLVLGLELLN
jgi:hypothetical protein